MHLNHVSSARRSFAVCIICALCAVGPRASAAVTTGTVSTPGELKYLIILDDSAGKAYLHVSGPANRWFGWGFGEMFMGGYGIIFNAGGTGNVYESNIEQYVGANPQSTQNITSSYCVNGGTIYYTVVRDLQTTDPNDYVFSSAPGTMNTIWAMGDSQLLQYHGSNRDATTFSKVSATKPKVASIGHGFGSTTLTLTNLTIALTNKIEFSTDLKSTNWTTLSNVVVSPPCGPLIFSILTNKTVTLSATNSAGFYRIKQ